ncbi:hypothetical protein TSUD_343660 [Trifolium subterraneum]|nr:hypothetical protein TSUD_343660 [Trifolium subterraneum]
MIGLKLQNGMVWRISNSPCLSSTQPSTYYTSTPRRDFKPYHPAAFSAVTQIPNIASRNSWIRTWEWALKIYPEMYTNWKCPNSVPKCISSHLRSCAVTLLGLEAILMASFSFDT